jgi:D-serine deaminase-like pyridoxal phosphate-dependent protein
MDSPLDIYQIKDADQILTPALLVYPGIVDANIQSTLKMAGDDPNRWRPHIKTAKIPAILQRLIRHGVVNFKCSTTLELLTACNTGATDVLLAYPVMGANAMRAREIAKEFPSTRISVLVETGDQAAMWRGTNIGIFIDVNPGMDRTGIAEGRATDIAQLARQVGAQFRGIHYYDGHMSAFGASEREERTHQGYDRLFHLVNSLLEAAHVNVGEVITSGTPAAPFAMSYKGFRAARFVHRISPGTVVYNDMSSLEQLPGFGYQAAAIVLATLVSRPTERLITCDAGHKSVSADAGVPTCTVMGHADWTPAKPSEEHLPLEVPPTTTASLGQKIYLLPRHVCPTVNNFDEALMVVNGHIDSVERVSARGHETLISAACIT